MEGVEDLPEIVLSAGIPWEWEGFGSYLDFLKGSRFPALKELSLARNNIASVEKLSTSVGPFLFK